LNRFAMGLIALVAELVAVEAAAAVVA
jgi:hypothetical protein